MAFPIPAWLTKAAGLGELDSETKDEILAGAFFADVAYGKAIWFALVIGAGVALVWAGVGLGLGRKYDEAVALEAGAPGASALAKDAPLEDKA